MEYRELHDWPADEREAWAIQEKLASRIDLYGDISNPGLIASVGTASGFAGEVLFACAVVTTYPEIDVVERAFCHGPPRFDYVPGLLYFREGPVVMEALSKLNCNPDLIFVHGHGIAHSRRCGMASHVGLSFDLPSIGCARKLLAGHHRPVQPEKGSHQPIVLRSREVGVAYRSKDNVKPIFISPGYRCDLAQARDLVVSNLRGYRLPEPLRLAHLFANKYKRRMEKNGLDKRQVVTENV